MIMCGGRLEIMINVSGKRVWLRWVSLTACRYWRNNDAARWACIAGYGILTNYRDTDWLCVQLNYIRGNCFKRFWVFIIIWNILKHKNSAISIFFLFHAVSRFTKELFNKILHQCIHWIHSMHVHNTSTPLVHNSFFIIIIIISILVQLFTYIFRIL